MRKLLVLMLAVLLLGVAGMAKTNYFDNIVVEGTATVTTTSFATLTVGGGYGSTGVSISATGVYQGDGGITSDATITGLTLTDGTLSMNSGYISGVQSISATTFSDGTITLSAGSVSGTWVDLGTVTTIDIDGGTINGITDLAVADGGTGSSTAYTARDALGLAIGEDVQTHSANLATFAAIAPSADIQSFLGSADDSAARTDLGVAIDSDVLAYDIGLSNLADIAMVADRFYYTSADNTHVAGTVTAFGRSILDDASDAVFRETVNLEPGIDVQTYSANLVTFSAITPTANAQTLLIQTYSEMAISLSLEIGADTQAWDADLDTFALLTPTADAQTLLESTNFLSMTQDLSIEIGVDVLAFDAGLSNLAGITMAADQFYYTSADNVHQTASVTSFARSMLDDADAATVITTLGLDDGITILDTTADTPAAPASGVQLYWNGTNLVALNAGGQTESLTSW